MNNYVCIFSSIPLVSLNISFLTFSDLDLGQIVLIGELLHHVRNTILDVGEHTTEHNLELIKLAVRLLNVVVSNLANLSKSDDSVLQLIATFRALVFQETLLFRDEHFVHTLVQWRTERSLFGGGWHGKVQPCLFFVGNVQTVHQGLGLAKSILGFKPHGLCVFVQFSILGCLDTQDLLQALGFLVRRVAIDDVDQNRQKLVLSRVAFFKLLALLVAETKEHLLQDGANINRNWQILVHLRNHRKNVVIHSQSSVFVGVTQCSNNLVGNLQVVGWGGAVAEIFQSGASHPSNMFFGNRWEAVLRTLDLAKSNGKVLVLAFVIKDKLLGVTWIICSSKRTDQ
mmetsp:Transcript_12625/g.26067  ORF Transcript_12625/g.26067 Transcript_12625/m.26067 type:complete len:341 (-) Transcript_12625:2502-3524(-)